MTELVWPAHSHDALITEIARLICEREEARIRAIRFRALLSEWLNTTPDHDWATLIERTKAALEERQDV